MSPLPIDEGYGYVCVCVGGGGGGGGGDIIESYAMSSRQRGVAEGGLFGYKQKEKDPVWTWPLLFVYILHNHRFYSFINKTGGCDQKAKGWSGFLQPVYTQVANTNFAWLK